MLVYIDESGHPHPNDPASRPVVVAACIQERDARTVAGRLHGIKRDVLGRERMEMKGSRLINRPTFRRRADMVAFVEEFFHEEGRACTNITDTPFFGDSKASAGVQIADMIASVIRQYEEAELYKRRLNGRGGP